MVSLNHISRVPHVALAVLAVLVTAPSVSGVAQADPCPAVEVAFARGTGQPPGVGNVGQAFIDSLRGQAHGLSVGVYAVNYPANPAFAASARNGADDLTAHVQDVIGRCPDTRLVLGGYSQGAGVIDMATQTMPPEVADHVAAIALFGNPTSQFARAITGSAFAPIGPPYNAKTTDVCADGDPTCSGGGNFGAHGSYVASGLAAQAATFAASHLQA